MVRLLVDNVAHEWQHALAQTPPGVVRQLSVLVKANVPLLVKHFYDRMLSDPVASVFLTHAQVRSRLQAALERWLIDVFGNMANDNLMPTLETQRRVGEVHARVGVPLHVVLRGARTLKQRLAGLLQETTLDAEECRQAESLVASVIDLAMEVMSSAYSAAQDRHERAEESYRLFAVIHNVEAEKERQRASLYRWESRLYFQLVTHAPQSSWPSLNASDFGLWFRHKGAHVFQGTEETHRILARIDALDTLLGQAPDQPGSEANQQLFRLVLEGAHEIRYNLERLFAQYSALEAGRDALTRMLSRKFLPVVMTREMAYARETGTRFAMLVIDIDYFKSINDTHGHDAGDAVLQQFASVLANVGRAGDYAFRLGGEEFMLLMVDTQPEAAVRIGEMLRRKVEEELFRHGNQPPMRLTVSIGIAMHNGHPDYQETLRRADDALYRAKSSGRNRVVME